MLTVIAPLNCTSGDSGGSNYSFGILSRHEIKMQYIELMIHPVINLTAAVVVVFIKEQQNYLFFLVAFTFFLYL